MAIKEIPTNIQMYFKSLKEKNTERKESALKVKEKLVKKAQVLHEEVKSDYELYKKEYNLDLMQYEEFVQNKYINGKFLKHTKQLFINRKGSYEVIGATYNLYQLAQQYTLIYNIDKSIKRYEIIEKLNYKQYAKLIKTFYTTVQTKMIIEGAGYVYEGSFGWICINRIKLNNPKPLIDFKATKEREKQLKAEGKKIYNKEEAEWCEKNGIEYKAEDKRVFKKDEYCYEVPLINCKLPNAGKFKLELVDHRGASCRGKSNDELIKECNNNIDEICKLDVDLRTKLAMSVKANKTLYTKFIRNENQTSINAGKVDRKNRQ